MGPDTRKQVGDLSDSELETYSRQIVLKDIGYDGQVKLRNSRACVIGVGGLGSLIAPRLVGMGVGYVRLVDRDIVSRSDLHRQYLYDVQSIGKPKVEVAYARLSALNPDVMIDPLAESLNSMNARELIRDVDIVLDGLDSPMARRIANRTCHNLGIPYIFGAAIEAFGSMSTILPGRTFCLECVMSGLRDEDLPKCGVVGVHPAVLGIVTAVQTSEAVLLLTGQGPRLLNKMLYMDLRNLRLDAVDLTRSEDCPVCGSRPHSEMEPVPDIFFEETCARDGRRNFVITPRERVCVDLQALKGVLEKRDVRLKTSSELGVTFRLSRDLIASILKSGIMIAQTPPDPRGDYGDKVWESYRSILVDGLGLSSRILPSRKKGD